MNTNTTTTTKRVTKANRFADIKAILNGESVEYGTTIADAVAFIDNEIALLAKKNSGDKKPTKTQAENVGYTEQILDVLSTAVEPMTCAAIHKAIGLADKDYQVQKTAALLRPLVNDGKVVRENVRGKMVFSLA